VLTSSSTEHRVKYEDYRRVYEKLAKEAHKCYYDHLFNVKENSIKKLWKNLNMAHSYCNAVIS